MRSHIALALLPLCLSEYNPTAHITTSSYDRRCSEEKNNHPERASAEGRAVVPMDGLHPKHTQSRSWVQRYARAMKSEDVTTLQALHKEDAGIKLVQSASFKRSDGQKWFSFINIKIELLDLLEEKIHLAGDLWRKGQSLLDIGCGHGFVDAFFSLKYDMKVVGYDIPNSYVTPYITRARVITTAVHAMLTCTECVV